MDGARIAGLALMVGITVVGVVIVTVLERKARRDGHSHAQLRRSHRGVGVVFALVGLVILAVTAVTTLAASR